jgi:anthranilate synthase component 2
MMTDTHVLFIDNFDSFTYNLVDEFQSAGATIEIWRNDTPLESLTDRLAVRPPTLVVLSPGPGRPEGAGCLVDLIRSQAGRIPLLGICLGHQAIAQALGGSVGAAPLLVHGKPAAIFHDGRGLWQDLPVPFTAGRYHSLVVDRLPPHFRKSAWSLDGSHEVLMAMEHEHDPILGLQFHPESILTPLGHTLIVRALDWARRRPAYP